MAGKFRKTHGKALINGVPFTDWLKINIMSSVAVYVQIENLIQFAIAAGHIQSNDQLPSVRELSEKTQVNPNTVAKAYRDLEVMGLLYTRRGMGIYVNEGVQERCANMCRQQIAARLYEVVSEAQAAGMPKVLIETLVSKSAALSGQPYAETPSQILDLAKGKSKGK